LDLVGQLDTAFRILDPGTFITSRESVPIRAFENQRTGKDYLGAPIDDVGPGGVVSRTVQLALDMFNPIGVGQAGVEVARAMVPGAKAVLPQGESRLGLPGNLVQATGVNLRAQTTPDLLNARAQAAGVESYTMMEPFQKRALKAEPELSREIAQRQETSAIQGMPSGVYGQETSKLVQAFEAKWAEIAKTAKVRSAQQNTPAGKVDKNAILDQWYTDTADLASRKDQTGKVLFGDSDYPDVMDGIDLKRPGDYVKVQARIAEAKQKGPLQGALAEHYFAYELARHWTLTVSGMSYEDRKQGQQVIPGALTQAMESIGKDWTLEQREYVLRNTNLNPPPQEIFNLFSDKSRARYMESQAARQRVAP
jgi:hypothetical protein